MIEYNNKPATALPASIYSVVLSNGSDIYVSTGIETSKMSDSDQTFFGFPLNDPALYVAIGLGIFGEIYAIRAQGPSPMVLISGPFIFLTTYILVGAGRCVKKAGGTAKDMILEFPACVTEATYDLIMNSIGDFFKTLGKLLTMTLDYIGCRANPTASTSECDAKEPSWDKARKAMLNHNDGDDASGTVYGNDPNIGDKCLSFGGISWFQDLQKEIVGCRKS
jgi:hypothetical protein